MRPCLSWSFSQWQFFSASLTTYGIKISEVVTKPSPTWLYLYFQPHFLSYPCLCCPCAKLLAVLTPAICPVDVLDSFPAWCTSPALPSAESLKTQFKCHILCKASPASLRRSKISCPFSCAITLPSNTIVCVWIVTTYFNVCHVWYIRRTPLRPGFALFLLFQHPRKCSTTVE